VIVALILIPIGSLQTLQTDRQREILNSLDPVGITSLYCSWQLIDYLKSSKLLPRLQSAYRAHHSTETAVLRVMADILGVVDIRDLVMLTLLDLSATFDTVDHKTLLHCLKVSYGISDTVTDGLFHISAVDHSLFTVYHHHRFQRLSCLHTYMHTYIPTYIHIDLLETKIQLDTQVRGH